MFNRPTKYFGLTYSHHKKLSNFTIFYNVVHTLFAGDHLSHNRTAIILNLVDLCWISIRCGFNNHDEEVRGYWRNVYDVLEKLGGTMWIREKEA